jgi:hypothetical protein
MPDRLVRPQQKRVLCEQNSKLIATVTEIGITVWCLYHKRPELITKEQCMAVWEKGESIQCVEECREAS